MKKQFLECGKIAAAHGVRGLFKTEVWCDSPRVLATQKRVFLADGDGYTERKVLSATASRDTVILGIEGIQTREDAVAMRGTVLYLAREDIPLADGAFFLQDLCDLPVIDADSGRVYGNVIEVTEIPTGLLLAIRTEDGEVLMPYVDEFVTRVDLASGVYVRPIPGFFREDI